MPLVLDLLRHGVALPATGGADEARPLAPRGRADLERLAAHLAGLSWRPDRAFASPLLRARQSAGIVLGAAHPTLEVEVMEALVPDADPIAALQALADARAGQGHVLLVGHQPLLGLLAAHLAGAQAPGFPPGCLVRIELAGIPAAGAGAVGWHLAPGFAG